MRRVYILPNLFTAGNLTCGLGAIFQMLAAPGDAEIVFACKLIFYAALFDLFDGLIARFTRSESAFGLYFDSLADTVSFGVAPAAIAYILISPANPMLANATCGLFVVCGAMRLARFNVQASREEKKSFVGLPIPGAGCAAASLLWLYAVRGGVAEAVPVERVAPPLLVVLAWLMVSKFRFFGFKSLRLSNRQPFEIMVTIVIVVFLLIALKDYLDVIMLAGFGVYVLSGPGLYVYDFRRRRAKEAQQPEPRRDKVGDTSSGGGPA